MDIDQQLLFPFGSSEAAIRSYFEKALGTPVSLTITDNSARMLSARVKGDTAHVRLHRIFLDAGDEVLREAALFIKKRRGSTPLIRKFIKEKSGSIKKKHKTVELKTRGRHYDLKEIFDRINGIYFEDKIKSPITWGANKKIKRVRRRTLGSYGSVSGIIRINPVLDSHKVPPFYIDFIVYHEMLHASMGISEKNGRRSVHPKEFRERERLFNDYGKVESWEKANRF